MTIDQEDVEVLARRVAQLLRDTASASHLVTAEEVARHTGMSLQWVYRNAGSLRARRFGRSLRFDLKEVESLVAVAVVERSNGVTLAAGRDTRRRRQPVLPPGVPLLKGRSIR